MRRQHGARAFTIGQALMGCWWSQDRPSAKVDIPRSNRDEGDGEDDPQGQPDHNDTDDNPKPHGIMLPASIRDARRVAAQQHGDPSRLTERRPAPSICRVISVKER